MYSTFTSLKILIVMIVAVNKALSSIKTICLQLTLIQFLDRKLLPFCIFIILYIIRDNSEFGSFHKILKNFL